MILNKVCSTGYIFFVCSSCREQFYSIGRVGCSIGRVGAIIWNETRERERERERDNNYDVDRRRKMSIRW